MTEMNPRARRLYNDYERLQSLVAQSAMIRILRTENNPPEKYQLALTCRGVQDVQGDQPVYSEYHVVDIYLPAGYPTQPPQVVMRTTVYHPNIAPSGPVCIGKWFAAKWLDELVYQLVEMIQYKNMNPDDPLNTYAAQWARRNAGSFPVDRRQIRLADVSSMIRLGPSDGPSAVEDDLVNRISLGGDWGTTPQSEDDVDITLWP